MQTSIKDETSVICSWNIFNYSLQTYTSNSLISIPYNAKSYKLSVLGWGWEILAYYTSLTILKMQQSVKTLSQDADLYLSCTLATGVYLQSLKFGQIYVYCILCVFQ